jgi:hypothetical protein
MIIRVRTTGVTVIIREGTRNHGSRSIEITKRDMPPTLLGV